MSDLNKVLEHLLAQNTEAAEAAINEWFTTQSAAILEGLNEDVTITINTDGAEDVATVTPVAGGEVMEGETDGVVFEFDDYSFIQFASGADAEIMAKLYDNGYSSNSAQDWHEEVPGELIPVPAGTLSAFKEALDAAVAEYDQSDDPEVIYEIGGQIMEALEPYILVESDDDMDEAVEEPVTDADASVELPVGDESGEDFGGEETAELSVDERVEDLEAELAALEAEFAQLMGSEAAEDAGLDGEEAEGEEEVDNEEEVEEAVDGFTAETFVSEDDDFAALEESYELEPVKAEKLKTEGETTGKGEKVKVETQSPVPQNKTTDRVGGKGVEIKGATHKGYERETAPKVAGGSEKFKNSQQEGKKVSKEGDKSAELNKHKEDKKAKSPINGDPKLRGKDFDRK